MITAISMSNIPLSPSKSSHPKSVGNSSNNNNNIPFSSSYCLGKDTTVTKVSCVQFNNGDIINCKQRTIEERNENEINDNSSTKTQHIKRMIGSNELVSPTAVVLNRDGLLKTHNNKNNNKNTDPSRFLLIKQVVECETVLFESMEECVGCIDGVDEQQTFEENLTRQAAHQRQIAVDHGMSEAEAALIRMQMQMQMMMIPTTGGNGGGGTGGGGGVVVTNGTDGILSTMERITLSTVLPASIGNCLNVCGQHGSFVKDLCDGIVIPVDTTLPTTQHGSRQQLVDTLHDRSTQSLVDVATDDDAGHLVQYGMVVPVQNDGDVVDGTIHQCAICYDSVQQRAGKERLSSSNQPSTRRPKFCHLPCCETRDDHAGKSLLDKDHQRSTTTKPGGAGFKVCTACMLILTVATDDGRARVGRCPGCRTWISIMTLHSTSSNMVVHKIESTGQCQSCMRLDQPLIHQELDGTTICDGCFLGRRVPLLYECEGCHTSQKIPSTLYRSQQSSSGYGTEMWPCNNCHRSCHWRLHYDQLPYIPAGDVPVEWGDDYRLDLARERVHIARQGIARLDLPGRNAKGHPTHEEGCTIM